MPAKASHCITQLGQYGYEASMLYGFRKLPLDEMLKGHHIVKITYYKVSEQDYENALSKAEAMLGTGYDWFANFDVAFNPTTRKWQDSSRYNCSEAQATILASAGICIFEEIGIVTPDMMCMLKGNM